MIDDLPGLVYLLAHDERAEGPWNRSRTELLVRAAALIDLASRGRLEEAGGSVTVTGSEPTGDPVLDAVLRDAAGGHGWKHLVRRRRGRTLAALEDRLAASGILIVREPRTPFGARRTTVPDRLLPAAVRARVTTALHGDAPVPDVPAADAALLALAAAGGVRSVVPRQDHRAFRARIAACTEGLAALAPGLATAVRTLPATMVAARGGMGGG